MSRAPLITVGLLAGAAVGGLLLWQSGDAEAPAVALGETPEPPSRDTEASSLVEAFDEPKPAADTASDPEAPVSATNDSREVLSTSLLRGRLTSTNGDPITDATVTWTPLPDVEERHWTTTYSSDWTTVDGRSVLARSLTTTTDAAGIFEFFEATTSDADSVLWASHPDFVAGAALLEAPEEGEPQTTPEIDLELQPAPSIRVRVLDGESAVANATVWQYGTNQFLESLGSRSRDALSVLVRSFETGPDGVVQVHPFPGVEGLRAVKDGRRSKTRSEDFRGDVVLRMHDTFTASGSAAFDPELNLEDEYVVDITARIGHIVQDVASSLVDTDAGTWGPVPVPLVGESEYEFRFHGGDAIPIVESRPAPQPSAEVSVDFEANPGNRMWALVSDPDGEILYDARVFARWTGEPAGKMIVRPFPRDHEKAAGFVLLKGIPDGYVNLAGFCDGYVPQYQEGLEVPELEPVTSELRLEKAARVTGRVLYEGDPVETFEVSYWNEDTDATAWRKTFTDREDGTFELLDAPTGELWVLAAGRTLARSEPVMARVNAGESAEVTLHLQAGYTGRLTLTNQETGEPVPDATIQRITMVGSRNISFWGPDLHSDSSGQALVDGLVDGGNSIRVQAEGFGDTWGNWRITDGNVVPFQLPMAPARQLTIRLRGVPEEELGRYVASVGASSVPGRLAFRNGDTVVAGPISAGRYAVDLFRDGEFARSGWTESPVSGEWLYEFNLEPSRRLVVSVLPAGDEALPEPLFVNANSAVEGHTDIQISENVTDGQAVIEGLPEGPAAIWVYGSAQRDLGRGQALQGPGETHVSLRVTGSELALRLVDTEQAPVPMTQVFVRKSTDRVNMPANNVTNDEGIARLAGFEPGLYEVHATNENLGVMVAMAELHEHEEGITEIVFDAEHALSLVATDDLGPIVGASARLICARDTYTIGARSTDARGTADWERISAGKYVLHLSHPGHWPVSQPVEVMELSAHVEVTMPRLGSVALRFQDSAGGPARGVPVTLYSHELQASIEDWIAAGQLQLGASSLTTDDRGALEVSGIPCGRYEWSVNEVGGTVEAVPEARPRFIVLP